MFIKPYPNPHCHNLILIPIFPQKVTFSESDSRAVSFLHVQGRQTEAEEKSIQKVELKVLMVLCYWIATGVFTFVIIALRFWQNNRPLEEFAAYFGCESGGLSLESPCDRSAIDRNVSSQALYDVVLMIYGTYPAVNLLYAVNFADLKRKWHQYSSRQSTSLPVKL